MQLRPNLNVFVLTLFAAGCGRVSFAPAADSGVIDAAPLDAQVFDGIRFRMDIDPTLAGGFIVAEPAQYSVSCGAMCPSSVAGMLGQAFYFDGTKHVDLGQLIDATNPYTIAFWLRPDVLTAGREVSVPISQALSSTTILDQVSFILRAQNLVGFEGTYSGIQVHTAVTLDVRNAWHHFALVQNGMSRELFIDGLFATMQVGPWATTSVEPVRLGADSDQNQAAFRYLGAIDDLRIYPRALTAAELGQVVLER